VGEQLIACHAAPCWQIRRRTGIESRHLEYLARRLAHALAQFKHQIAAAKFTRMPFQIVLHERGDNTRDASVQAVKPLDCGN
jgi:hypothetical protein